MLDRLAAPARRPVTAAFSRPRRALARAPPPPTTALLLASPRGLLLARALRAAAALPRPQPAQRAASFGARPRAPAAPPAAAAASKAFPLDFPLLYESDEMQPADRKRKAADGAGPSAPAAGPKRPTAVTVNPKRTRALRAGTPAGAGPALYWMSRDQRVEDNWALLAAVADARRRGAPVAVAFSLVPAFLGAGARQFGFMLRGLRELAPRLAALGVPFFLLRGDPAETVPRLVTEIDAALLVVDYSPLRLGRAWRAAVAAAVGVPVLEVDAHNVVPVWEASPKREYAARTIRPKIHAQLGEFMREFPAVPAAASWAGGAWPPSAPQPKAVDWDALLAEVTAVGAAVPEVAWCAPGEAAARAALDGPVGFLTKARLGKYADKRNDPAVSDLLCVYNGADRALLML